MNLYQFEDVDYKKRKEDQLKMDEHLRTMIIDEAGNRRRKAHGCEASTLQGVNVSVLRWTRISVHPSASLRQL